MTAQIARSQPRRGRQLKTTLTRCPQLIETAQRLRYRVFSEEYGSDLGATTPGIDADAYDALFDHLSSEEHPPELQSRPHIVCRLPLAQKTRTNIDIYPT